MQQEHEEPIRSFYACLKGQAGTCKYEMKCTKADCGQITDFTEEILCNVITRGIADQDIQLDLLGEKISSSYRRGKRQDAQAKGGPRTEKSKGKPEGTCIYCGEIGHGKTLQWRVRHTECPKPPRQGLFGWPLIQTPTGGGGRHVQGTADCGFWRTMHIHHGQRHNKVCTLSLAHHLQPTAMHPPHPHH